MTIERELCMSSALDAERRQRIRVPFQAQIRVRAGTRELKVDGNSRDFSLKGVFIRTDERIAPETPCHVQVLLSGTAKGLVLNMEGHVVRQEEHGMAVCFDTMDLDSYMHLKNVVRYNSEDPDAI
jgi:hypothetical protein